MKLVDGMMLYHGSYTPVQTIDLTKCAAGKDFGHWSKFWGWAVT